MARNKLTDLNNHLFEMLERFNDDELEKEHGPTLCDQCKHEYK